ncbi:MAG TPA: DUF3800 domain-containing protein [Stellaceae bacterium]|nr:DUF3800 domain-containing protein [Stellaceae bacterium]
MAWFLFIDESGQDHGPSPYEVLAGIAVSDESLWPLVQGIQDAEISHFGRRYAGGTHELKGKKILKSKVFRHAQLNCSVLPNEIPPLAKDVLDDGAVNNSVRHLKALALAKIAYVTDVFSLCYQHDCKIFASMVDVNAPITKGDALRKDYAYLFQRFFYFLEDKSADIGMPQRGIIVFDELEKSQSHILIDQAHRYFKKTATGRARAGLIIPEPFFVHSDLTTGVQIADLVAYCISWAFRIPNHMMKPARSELAPYASQIARMRYRATRDMFGIPNFEIWSVAHITDLRTQSERLDGA